VLSQAPIQAGLSSAASGAGLALRQYLFGEKPTALQLTENVQTVEYAEKSGLGPLESALFAAQVKKQQRAQRIKVESFNLRQQLAALTRDDTALASTDVNLGQSVSSLKGVLTGAGGAGTGGANAAVDTLEQLGTVEWVSGGVFVGIDMTDQGLAYDTETTIAPESHI
jgi:hypothetical protein